MAIMKKVLQELSNETPGDLLSRYVKIKPLVSSDILAIHYLIFIMFLRQR